MSNRVKVLLLSSLAVLALTAGPLLVFSATNRDTTNSGLGFGLLFVFSAPVWLGLIGAALHLWWRERNRT